MLVVVLVADHMVMRVRVGEPAVAVDVGVYQVY